LASRKGALPAFETANKIYWLGIKKKFGKCWICEQGSKNMIKRQVWRKIWSLDFYNKKSYYDKTVLESLVVWNLG
jgi:hypothetical protein